MIAAWPPFLTSLLWLLAGLLGLWVTFMLVLTMLGRREEAKAVARAIPDMIVLFKRLLADGRVPRRSKFALGLTLVYLASPIDIVPDFIPVVGQLDDAIVVTVVLRFVLRRCTPGLLAELWPGSQAGLSLLQRGIGRPSG
jgi:uncharacterized membrane protein YkvA (DUF1232 family)